MRITTNRWMILGFVFAIVLSMLVLFPSFQANAQTAKDAVCAGIGGVTDGANGCVTPDEEPTVDSTVATIINILSLLTAVIAVIMLIIGGIKYATSSGDSGSTASARNTVIYALVGLVIVALAQLIVQFVIERVAPT